MPELGEVQTLVREVEVVFQFVPHEGCDTDGKVAVTRKVAVDLHRETQYTHQVTEAGLYCGGIKDNVVVLCNIIRDKCFLDHSANNKPQSLIYKSAVDVLSRSSDLWKQYFGTGDGTGDEKREKGEIEGIVGQFCGLGVTSLVDIDRIADGLKGEEGDSYGQQHLLRREVAVQDFMEYFEREVRVLVIEQGSEFRQYDDGKSCPPYLPTFQSHHEAGKIP